MGKKPFAAHHWVFHAMDAMTADRCSRFTPGIEDMVVFSIDG